MNPAIIEKTATGKKEQSGVEGGKGEEIKNLYLKLTENRLQFWELWGGKEWKWIWEGKGQEIFTGYGKIVDEWLVGE